MKQADLAFPRIGVYTAAVLLASLLAAARCAAQGTEYTSSMEEADGRKYLVRFETGGKPALLRLDAYIPFLYPELADKYKSSLANHIYGEFDGKYRKNFSEIQKPGEGITAMPAANWRGLLDIPKGGDGGEAVACFVDYEDGQCLDFKCAENVPVKMAGNLANGGVAVNVALDGAADWKKFFHDGESFCDPSVRIVWLTTWDNLRARWDKLLEETEGRAEIENQMSQIIEAGRYKLPGGMEWRSRIEGYRRRLAQVASVPPPPQIDNSTASVSGTKTAVSDTSPATKSPSSGPDNARSSPASVSDTKAATKPPSPGPDNAGSSPVPVPDTAKAASVSDTKAATKPPSPGPDNAGSSPASVPDTAKAASVSDTKSATKPPSPGPDNAGSSPVPPAQPVNTSASAGRRQDQPKDPPTKGRPILREIKDNPLRFPQGRQEDCIAFVTIGKDYAVFAGKACNYANEKDVASFVQAVDCRIPVKVSFCGEEGENKYLGGFVISMLKEIVENDSSFRLDQDKGEFHLVLKTEPEHGTWIHVPNTSFHAGNWTDVRERLKNMVENAKSPADTNEVRHLLIGELPRAMPAWKRHVDTFLKLQDKILPKVTFVNNAGRTVVLSVGPVGSGQEGILNAGRTFSIPIRNIIGKPVNVREEGFESDEYVKNTVLEDGVYVNGKNEKASLSRDGTDDHEIPITPRMLDRKPAPVIRVNKYDYLNVKEVKVNYANGASADVEFRDSGIVVEAHREINAIIFVCEGYTSVDVRVGRHYKHGDIITELKDRLNQDIDAQNKANKVDPVQKRKEKEYNEVLNDHDYAKALEFAAGDRALVSKVQARARQDIVDALKKDGDTDKARELLQSAEDAKLPVDDVKKEVESLRRKVMDTEKEIGRLWNYDVFRNKPDYHTAKDKIREADFGEGFGNQKWRERWLGIIAEKEIGCPQAMPDEKDMKEWAGKVGKSYDGLRKQTREKNRRICEKDLNDLFSPKSSLNKKDVPQRVFEHVSKCTTTGTFKCPYQHGGGPDKDVRENKKAALQYLMLCGGVQYGEEELNELLKFWDED